jgi:hypothetical protein
MKITAKYEMMRTIVDKLSDAYDKFYSPTAHLAVSEFIVLFKGRVISREYIPKKHEQVVMKIYEQCHSKGHTYNMTMYSKTGNV